jgi:replication fork clamp-binding protein CrfC
LFSFETRELVKHFLESRQPGFKAGFFGRSAKTKSEQDQRLAKLYVDLLARSEANLTWHLRTILAEIPARYDLSVENYTDQVSQMSVKFEPELLIQTIRPGAMLSGQYVLNYTRDLTDAIRSVYWQSSKVWINRAQEAAHLKTQQELSSLQEHLEYQRRALKSLAELRKLNVLHHKHMSGLITSWEQVRAIFPEADLWGDLRQANREIQRNAVFSQSVLPSLKTNIMNTAVRRGHPKLWKTAQDLKACADLLNLLPGFGLRAESLEQRATRLEDNLFTVALFGAFSAGKSSLANALLGASVLPVSPNPTTATINKILPPTDQYPHGTTKVKLKSIPDLTTDVLSSLAVLGLSAVDLKQALLEIPSLDSLDVALEAKPHLSFLKAVARGQAALLEYLGEELTVGFSAFSEFVVQEDKACFVESIELYFSCPLTELGVVLVDTPGSNSTNARHTNVAFDYIRNADAVLFVTYYNNPFCKADAQFLSQLGKVKDAFEMDKLFFLVNAADLAQTSEELKLVVNHIEQNLRSCDIIRPRIFPVSSQLALLAKQASSGDLQPQAEQLYRKRLKLSPEEKLPESEGVLIDSGLEHFESSFHSFIGEELINLAVESAEKEIQRNFHYVVSLLEAAKSDASQRIEKLQLYRTLEQDVLSGLEHLSLLAEERSIGQELDELFYYVNQRLTHRYSNLFDRNFFSLMQPKVEQPRRVAQQCIGDFLQEIEVELGQEARATFLRAERFLQKSLERVLGKYEDFVNQYDPQCNVQNGYKIHAQDELKFALLSWDNDSLAKVPDLYKNSKDWVEGRGKEKMKETLIKILQPQIQAWINDCSGFYKKFWNKRFELESKELKEQICSDVSGHYSGLAIALGDGYNLEVLEHVRGELQKVR